MKNERQFRMTMEIDGDSCLRAPQASVSSGDFHLRAQQALKSKSLKDFLAPQSRVFSGIFCLRAPQAVESSSLKDFCVPQASLSFGNFRLCASQASGFADNFPTTYFNNNNNNPQFTVL